MADFGDTSSYPKATMPVSPLETVKNIAGVVQQKQQIDQAKLDQANQALGYMVRAMGSLGPNAKKEDYAKAAQNAVDQGLVPQQQENIFLTHLQNAPDSQSFYKQFMSAAMEGQKQIDLHMGQNVQANDQAGEQYGKRDVISGAVRPVSTLPTQLPPTTEAIDTNPTLPNGEPNPAFRTKGPIGALGPPGFQPARGSLPAEAPLPPTSMNGLSARSAAAPMPLPVARPRLPVERPVSGPIGPTVQTSDNFNGRFGAAFPQRVTSSLAPGVAEAQRNVGEQSGKDMATDLTRARNLQADLQPDLAVLNIVKDKKPGDFGPGTDALNTVKKLAVTWLPNVDQKLINDSTDYDTVKKYLVQGARGNGNTGSNDQLAAAIEGNPNVTMNTATIENIVKSRVALRKMEAASSLMALKEGIPEDQYSKWIAKNQNQFDPRAFALDIMTDTARNKLISSLAHKDNAGNWVANKGKEKEFKKFENSRLFAEDASLIENPARKQ